MDRDIERGDTVWILFTPNHNRILGPLLFWWMTGPVPADPGTCTGVKRAGNWKKRVVCACVFFHYSLKSLQDGSSCLRPVPVCSLALKINCFFLLPNNNCLPISYTYRTNQDPSRITDVSVRSQMSLSLSHVNDLLLLSLILFPLVWHI